MGCFYYDSYKYAKKLKNPKDIELAIYNFKKALEIEPKNKFNLSNLMVASIITRDYKLVSETWQKYVKYGYASKDD